MEFGPQIERVFFLLCGSGRGKRMPAIPWLEAIE
jgi:hypothetical protein